MHRILIIIFFNLLSLCFIKFKINKKADLDWCFEFPFWIWYRLAHKLLKTFTLFYHILPHNMKLNIKVYWTKCPTCCKEGIKESRDEKKNLHFALSQHYQLNFKSESRSFILLWVFYNGAISVILQLPVLQSLYMGLIFNELTKILREIFIKSWKMKPWHTYQKVFLWLSGRALRQQRKRLWVQFPGNTHTD